MSGGGRVGGYPRSHGIPTPPVRTPSGSHQNTSGWQASGTQPTGMLSCYKRFTLLNMLNLLNCQPCHTFCKQFCFAVKKVYIKQKQNYTVILM